jgi:hypothetical protein
MKTRMKACTNCRPFGLAIRPRLGTVIDRKLHSQDGPSLRRARLLRGRALVCFDLEIYQRTLGHIGVLLSVRSPSGLSVCPRAAPQGFA